jgi:hypothetical protein
MQKATKPTIADIRADEELGRGSCSIYDEAHTDEELQQEIDELFELYGARTIIEMRDINRRVLAVMAEREGYHW